MSLSLNVRLREARLYVAIMLCVFGLTLFLTSLFSSQINAWLSSHLLLSLALSTILMFFGVLIFTRSQPRQKSYTIRQVEGLKVTYTPSAVVDAIAPVLEKLIPHGDVKKDVLFHKGSIHIFIDLPYHPEEQQKTLLETIERELKGTLHRLFSYDSDFLLVTSFQDAPPS